MDQGDPDPLESLPDELDKWRKTPFDRLATITGVSWHPTALTAAVTRTRGTNPGAVQLKDIRALLIAAVAAAEQRNPPADDPRGQAAVNGPAVIREVFGLTNESKNLLTAGRQERAGKALGQRVSGHVIRRAPQMRAHINHLATWLREYLDEPVTPSGETETARRDPTIPREEDLAWLRETYETLRDRHGGVCQLWGIAGIGKSTLAAAFADLIGPKHVVGTIRVGQRGLQETDLQDILKLEGIYEEGMSDAQVVTAFRSCMATYRATRALRLLILDGVETPEQVIDLIPRGVTIPTVITTRERLIFPINGPNQLKEVSARRLLTFTRAQAVQLLHQRAPDLDDDLADRFAAAAGGHAETLVHIASCLALPDATPTGLLEDLSRRPQQALLGMMHALRVSDCAANAIEKLLTQVRRDSWAYTIVTCLTWTEDTGQLPKSFVLDLAATVRGEPPTSMTVIGALNHLEQLGLVGETSDSLRMSRITSGVIRDLTMSACAQVMVAYEHLVSAEPDDPERRDLLTTLRLEYGFARPLQQEIAEFFPADRLPAFICIDTNNWALLHSDSHGRRFATMYRVTPGALLCFYTDMSRQWKVIPDDSSGGIIRSAERYYQLVSEGWRQRWPEEQR